MLTELLKQLASTASRAALAKAVELLQKHQAKKKAQEIWASTPNQPWGCEFCKNWNYLGGPKCAKCGKTQT